VTIYFIYLSQRFREAVVSEGTVLSVAPLLPQAVRRDAVRMSVSALWYHFIGILLFCEICFSKYSGTFNRRALQVLRHRLYRWWKGRTAPRCRSRFYQNDGSHDIDDCPIRGWLGSFRRPF